MVPPTSPFFLATARMKLFIDCLRPFISSKKMTGKMGVVYLLD